ncbi:MAG: DNA recombination protein RmuC [Gammaproteobacteria bacterium]|nr:MAG: DNA recombination protein RmuC [Gammaproteobacteria bacterium]
MACVVHHRPGSKALAMLRVNRASSAAVGRGISGPFDGPVWRNRMTEWFQLGPQAVWMLLAALLTGLLAGLGWGQLRLHRLRRQQAQNEQTWQRQLESSEQACARLQEAHDRKAESIEDLQAELARERASAARLEAERDALQRAIEELRTAQARQREQEEQLRQELGALRARRAELEARLEEQQKRAEERLAELEQARKQLRSEFENLANRIFEEQGRQFSERNRKGLDEILGPVRQQLDDFRKRVDEIHAHEQKGRGMLEQQLRQLQDLNRQLNEEARNLTRALKGDRKAQGTWGEIVLERVLEHSGLRKGQEYELQPARRNSEGSLLRPDAIIHLPEGKDVIVDSKVSLSDYEQYVNAGDELEAAAALKRHVRAVRDHVERLGGKNYEDLEGVHSLDFVLMFMPIEGAFTVAFQEDPELFSRAFDQRIIIVTPTTLLATLRTIENMWRFERQNENTRRIAERAGKLYDKLRGFLEDFERIGQQLDTVRGTWDKARGKLVQGRGNLIRQAEEFVELGIKVKKQIPQALREEAGALQVIEDETETGGQDSDE